MTPLYEGKAKRLFPTDHPDELLMEFKDSATAFNGAKKAEFENKGRFNKALTVLLYRALESRGVPTHFLREAGDIAIIVKRVTIIPIELVVRNVVAGSLAKRLGRPEGERLRQPLVELYYKDDALGDPMINDEHVRELALATDDELARLKQFGLRINDRLTSIFAGAGLTLVDFKLEFGRLANDPSSIVLADEISPDTCRLWDAQTGEKMDKDRFRRDLGGVMESYAEVLRRLEMELAPHA
ncbi:MAG: phosphoribosylaminoimidazolesuccinocarboxamide synthase [Verrucomicrobiales bacterium]